MISEKYLKAYLKEYATEYEKERKPRRIYRDSAHYLEECLLLYERHIKASTLTEEIDNWLVHIRYGCNPFLLGVKTAFEHGDMEILHNALYQLVAIKHATSGGNYGSGNMDCVLTASAAGLTERIPLLLPQELGLCDSGFPPHVAMTNLTMVLWYKRKDWEASSRRCAEKRLSTKMPLLWSTAIHYLLALLDGDTKEAGVQLELHCCAVPSIRDKFHATKIEKMFWCDAHGLYNLAFFVLGKKKALEISMPEHDCFCNDLAQWQIDRNFTPGELFVRYPAPMELLNEILNCMPPASELTLLENTGTEQVYVGDAKGFKEKITASVLSK